MIRVLLVDDDALVRSGLRIMLAGAASLEVVGEAADGREVLGAVDLHRPDVVLMDIRMPQLDGIAATRLLAAQPDPPAVLVLTTFDADELVLRALQAGAAGFLLKDTPPAEIVRAIEFVHAGDGMLSPAITRRLISLVAGDSDAGARTEHARERTGDPQPARARCRPCRRPRPSQRRDRRNAPPLRRDRQGARLPPPRQARGRQPRPNRPARAGSGQVLASSTAEGPCTDFRRNLATPDKPKLWEGGLHWVHSESRANPFVLRGAQRPVVHVPQACDRGRGGRFSRSETLSLSSSAISRREERAAEQSK